MPWRPIMMLLAAAALHWTAQALAEKRDQDAARDAVTRGEIRPLAEILGSVRSRLPGRLIGVEIETKGGRWLYEFRVMDQ